MSITVNGQPQEVALPISVAELLRALDKKGPQVAVEVNEQLVPKADHESTELSVGDSVEIVTLVGGG